MQDTGNSVTDPAVRVLSYQCVINRLSCFRPLKLSWLSGYLESIRDLLEVLDCFAELFPAEYHWFVERRTGQFRSIDVYQKFLELVNSRLFPVETWVDLPCDGGNYYYIPLHTFGWCLDDLSGTELHLLYVPLACCLWPEWADTQWHQLEQYGFDVELLCDRVQDLDVPRAVSRLERMTLPPPLDGLPAALRAMMGYEYMENVFLDVPCIYFHESFGGEPPSWDKKVVEWLAQEWSRAQPILDKTWGLVEACGRHPEKARFVRLIFQLMLGDEPDIELLTQFRRAAETRAEEDDFSRQQTLAWEENSIW